MRGHCHGAARIGFVSGARSLIEREGRKGEEDRREEGREEGRRERRKEGKKEGGKGTYAFVRVVGEATG